MKSKIIIETRGLIIKEEKMKALGDKMLNNTMVLESIKPYIGYYGRNMPNVDPPRSIFIILNKKYDSLFLSRVIQNVSKKLSHTCYGAFGTIEIDENKLYCTRIKNLDCFDSLPKIQEMMIKEGVKFHKALPFEKSALIRIQKSFLINEIEKGIYKDDFEPDRYYISIGYPLSFEEFRDITIHVKNNINDYLFDAALAVIWRVSGLEDLIRIYDRKHDLNTIRLIRDMYLSEIQKRMVTQKRISNYMSEAHL